MITQPKALLLDISGVIYQGDRPIAGAVAAVKRLRDSNLRLRFVTNTSRRPRRRILESLADMGFPIAADELFTAPLAARRWLEAERRRPLLLIHPDLQEDFAGLDTREPDAVLLADAGNELNYANLDAAFALLMDGAPLLAVGTNRYFQGKRRLHLDAGPFVRALEYAAGVEAIVAGKPSGAFYEQVLADVECQPDEALMVGDDVNADVQGALDAGLHACLVRTGKYRDGDEAGLPRHAAVAASVVDVVNDLIGPELP